jgi:hypothetical protein
MLETRRRKCVADSNAGGFGAGMASACFARASFSPLQALANTP